jgi:hypothetical protein
MLFKKDLTTQRVTFSAMSKEEKKKLLREVWDILLNEMNKKSKLLSQSKNKNHEGTNITKEN